MTNSNGDIPRVSWDGGRSSAPPRPTVDAGTVRPMTLVGRPQRLLAAIALVIVAVGVLLYAAITTAANFSDVHESLVTIIETELDEEYSADDMAFAANLLLRVTWCGAVLLAGIAVLSVCLLFAKRSRSARNWFVTTTMILVPATALTVLLRDAEGLDLLASAGGILLLFVAIVIVLTPRVGVWLRQADHHERKPLVSATTGESAA